MPRVGRTLAAVLFVSLLTGCAQDPGSPATEDTPSASSASTAKSKTDRPSPEPAKTPSRRQTQPGTTVTTANSDFGTILFDKTGQAIYMFDVEATTKPRCYGDCADAWPPVFTRGAPRAGKQVKQSLLGTTRRADGRTQVTYGGHPLYFYAHEGKHEVECHDVFLNGGTWYAVQPDGRRAP